MNPYVKRIKKNTLSGKMVNSLHAQIDKYWDENNINLLEENEIITPEQVEILRLYFVDCLTFKEIAVKLNLTPARIQGKVSGKRGSILSKLIGASSNATRLKRSKKLVTKHEAVDFFKLSNKETLIEGISKMSLAEIRSLYRKINNK